MEPYKIIEDPCSGFDIHTSDGDFVATTILLEDAERIVKALEMLDRTERLYA